MISAIVYTSNTGYTRQYAELLAAKTGLPAYNLKNSIPPAARGKEIIYMGWIMAGGVQGYQAAAKRFRIRAVCQVGMGPSDGKQNADAAKRYALGSGTPLFYLRGGFDLSKLHGVYKFMMRAMCKKIIGDLKAKPALTPEEQELLKMATEGSSCVSEENLAGVLEWYRSLQQETEDAQ